jgi:hypothetical protein
MQVLDCEYLGRDPAAAPPYTARALAAAAAEHARGRDVRAALKEHPAQYIAALERNLEAATNSLQFLAQSLDRYRARASSPALTCHAMLTRALVRVYRKSKALATSERARAAAEAEVGRLDGAATFAEARDRFTSLAPLRDGASHVAVPMATAHAAGPPPPPPPAAAAAAAHGPGTASARRRPAPPLGVPGRIYVINDVEDDDEEEGGDEAVPHTERPHADAAAGSGERPADAPPAAPPTLSSLLSWIWSE